MGSTIPLLTSSAISCNFGVLVEEENMSFYSSILDSKMDKWDSKKDKAQDGWVMMESSDKTSSAGEGNGKPLRYSFLENLMNSKKRQKYRTLKDEFPGLVDAQNVTGEEWRNNSRINEEAELKWKQWPVAHVSDSWSQVQFCKKKYCIGTWNVSSMNPR